MDIVRPSQPRQNSDRESEIRRAQGGGRLEDEYREYLSMITRGNQGEENYQEQEEWLVVDTEENQEDVDDFVPPVFEYQPRKKKGWSKWRKETWYQALWWCGGIALAILVLTGGILWFSRDAIEHSAEAGFLSLEKAKEALLAERYDDADQDFRDAKVSFEEAYGAIPFWSHPLLAMTRYIPGLTEGASAQNVLIAGIHISESGPAFIKMAHSAERTKGQLQSGQEFSVLGFFRDTTSNLQVARKSLDQASQALEKVNIKDVPEEKRKAFLLAKEQLPAFLGIIDTVESHNAVVEELLGNNGPRKYLFLLENNHELRPTGGFIGSYALLEMQDGKVKNFFVDGIFNPDGQLKENIVPPKPLQKVSAGWSLHDSNWFPDFPTSAEKAIFFYEKTGGPTVDGVIALTPVVTQKLLELTGPVSIPKYGLTVTADNFFPVIQEEVEVNYDKKENKPKAVLADLSTILLERLLHSRDEKVLLGTLEAITNGLNQKQMLLYVRDGRVEKLIRDAGWSGEIRMTDKDYLNVIHANINGYKTDGVIKDVISHKAEIQPDGTVIDTVRITRKHTGGATPYEWWNKVNADYMRVYVPLGSELLSVEGHTYEFPESPLDYNALGFKKDVTVTALEASEHIDAESGTRIGEEAGKTVFGNWVYVSPQEEVTVEYRYKLPFKVVPGGQGEEGSGYSLLVQKQPGVTETKIETELDYPETYQSIWQTGRNLVPYENAFRSEGMLLTDTFIGVAFDNK